MLAWLVAAGCLQLGAIASAEPFVVAPSAQSQTRLLPPVTVASRPRIEQLPTQYRPVPQFPGNATIFQPPVPPPDDSLRFGRGPSSDPPPAPPSSRVETGNNALPERIFNEDDVEPGDPDRGTAAESDGETDEDEDSLVKRIEKLEESWEKAEQKKLDDKAAAAKKPSLKISGRIHLDSWNFPYDTPGIGFFENPGSGIDPEDRVFFRRIRLTLAGELFDTMLYKYDVDFNEPENPQIKDAFFGFQELPVFQTVLFGNQKRPLGLDHLNSSNTNIFMERPLVVEAFNEDARRIGVQSLNVSDDEVYNWQYGAFLLENVQDTGGVVGDSKQGSLNGRLASSPWYDEPSDGRYYFHWAVAGMLARPDGDADPFDSNPNSGRFRTRSEVRSDTRWLDTGAIPGAEWYEIVALESIYNYGPFQVVGEYQTTFLQRDDTTAGTGPNVHFHGGYVYAAYTLTGEHMPYDRESGTLDPLQPYENFFVVRDRDGGVCNGWGAWQVAARYSYLDLTDGDIAGGVEHNFTLGLVWYWNAYASMQFNAVSGWIDEHEPVGGFTEGEFVGLGTRMRVFF